MEEKIKTRVVVNKYFEAGEITPPFNSILFANEGTSDVILNGLTILPGQVYIDNGFQEEFNFTVYRFRFVAPGVNRLMVAKKEIVNGL
jgi:hypothetical protein